MKKTIIIAEAATNHEGDVKVAKKMIKAATLAGADYVKFQSATTKTMDPNHPHYTAMRPKELSDQAHHELIKECQKSGIKFLTTCFDWQRVDFLSKLGLDTIKVASTDVGGLKMLKLLRDKFRHIILSTGMCYEQELKDAINILKSGDFTLLHCVSNYPVKIEHANLSRMSTLKKAASEIAGREVPVGYSDHTLGNDAVKIAITLGADMIEKHFTLKRVFDNKYSNMSALPEDIREIVDFAKNYRTYLGSGDLEMQPGEKESRDVFWGRWGDNR
jgi:sialic acid synthase SpsE